MKIENLMREEVKDQYGVLKLQNVILNIMKHIDDFCERHGINYYIIGGTALGAVRHEGFIPWDDDLDIAMTRENYNRFIDLYEKEGNKDDFFLQVGRRDWPLYFSKLRLLGTRFEESGALDEIKEDKRGIFVDIFPLDVASSLCFIRLWQYVCSKLLIAEALSNRHYHTNSLLKKMIIFLSKPVKIPFVQQFLYCQVLRFNKKKTGYIGDFFEITRFKDAAYPIRFWGNPKKIMFEKIALYGPEMIKDYLTLYFGNYMELPPVEKRKCGHNNGIDFGNY